MVSPSELKHGTNVRIRTSRSLILALAVIRQFQILIEKAICHGIIPLISVH